MEDECEYLEGQAEFELSNNHLYRGTFVDYIVDDDDDDGQDDPSEYQLEMMNEKGEKFHCIQRERTLSDSTFEDSNSDINKFTLTLPSQLA